MVYFTVSGNVAVCCNVPDVAVTETVDVTGVLLELTQPVNRARPITLTASSSMSCTPRRFFQPKKHSATASADPGNNGPELK
jgi:hypothetical protein